MQDVWTDVHACLEEALGSHTDPSSIREEIAQLRHLYRNGQAPDFARESARWAYAVAYHPAHVFTYLHLLLRRELGPAMFGHTSSPPRILVLGAGAGAETAAILRWFDSTGFPHAAGTRIMLADRADWFEIRRKMIEPVVGDFARSKQIKVEHTRIDFTASGAERFLRNHGGQADLVVAPSLLTELTIPSHRMRLLGHLQNFMRPHARLAIIDHNVGTLKADSLSPRGFRVVEQGRQDFRGAVLPKPTQWIRKHFLRGGALSSKDSYPMVWSVLERE